jgi:hypothetical protein
VNVNFLVSENVAVVSVNWDLQNKFRSDPRIVSVRREPGRREVAIDSDVDRASMRQVFDVALDCDANCSSIRLATLEKDEQRG